MTDDPSRSDPAVDAVADAPVVQDPGENLTAQTVTGLKWTYLRAFGSSGMQLVYTATMSRLLAPDLFGVFAIASLAVSFAGFFSQMGLGQALIQKEELTEDDIRAGFTSSVVLGAAVTLLVVLTAPWIADVFREPEAVGVLRVMSLTFFVTGLQLTSRSLLRRELRFRSLAIIETSAFAIGFLGVGIGMAVAGAGVWSLVGANIGSNVFGTVGKMLARRHGYRPLLRWGPYRDLLGFGSRMSGSQLLEFVGSNLDTFSVGRFATSAALGQYNRAFYLINLPMAYLTDSLSQVLFPGFSRVQQDQERLRRVWGVSTRLAGVIAIPVCAGAAVASQDLVATVLGDQWGPAAVVFPFLTVAAGANVVSRFASIATEARAELNAKLVVQVLHVVIVAAMLLVVAGGPLWHYGAVIMVGELVRHAMFLVLMRRVVGTTASDVAAVYGPVLFAAALVAAATAGGRLLGHAVGLPVFLALLLEVGAAGVALVVALRTPVLARSRGDLRELLGRAGVLKRGGLVGRALDLVLGAA